MQSVSIVVATIPLALSLHYLSQPVPLVSLPRRYHRHVVVSARPYSDCDHMKVKKSIFRMTVRTIFSSAPVEAIPRSVVSILSSLTVQTKL